MPGKRMTAFAFAIVAAMFVAGIATALAVPGEASLPVHWDIAGRPDRFADKWTALLMLPVTAAFVTLLFAALPRLEPLRDGLERSGGLVAAVWVGTTLVLAAAQGATIAVALGRSVPVATIILVAIGGLMIIVGDRLAKSRRMFLVGIRTPWTLADEDVWIATHRLGGRLMLVCGLCFWGLAIVQPREAVASGVLIGALLATVAVPVAYSYLLWRRKARDRR